MKLTSLDLVASLIDQAHALGATGADAVMFETVDLTTSRRLGKQEGLERSENHAFGLRAFIGNQQAIVSSSDTTPQALKELAERAVTMAKAAPADPDSKFAPSALLADTTEELELLDTNEPDAHWLQEQCKLAEDAARGVPGITNSEGADAGYSRSRMTLAIGQNGTTNFLKSYEASHFSLSVSVIAGSGTDMERDYDFSTVRHRHNLADAATIGVNAANRALKRLGPRKVASCQVPVVFDPRVSRSLLSVLAGAISGAAIARGSSFLKGDLNQPIFAPNITIIDDPHIPSGLGSKPFDGEGVAGAKRPLVENGVLTSWLLDMRSASKLGMQTTGHASRGIASPPSPSSSNLYLVAGKQSPHDMIGSIKNGLYLTETFGMGINTTTGDYSQGAAGFWIENGEIAYPVSEITIAGHLRDMFKHMIPASDLDIRYATNAPTVLVERMTVAGL